jgi:hypothetical protein
MSIILACIGGWFYLAFGLVMAVKLVQWTEEGQRHPDTGASQKLSIGGRIVCLILGLIWPVSLLLGALCGVFTARGK